MKYCEMDVTATRKPHKLLIPDSIPGLATMLSSSQINLGDHEVA